MQLKRILVPTDFSKAGNNASEYAAQLAIKSRAELSLVHALSIPSLYGEVTSIGVLKEYAEIVEREKHQLKDYCDFINKEFNIQCKYFADVTTISEELKMHLSSSPFDLIVIGTNGADNLYQFYFGTNSYRVSKNIDCPLLIVPEEYSYKNIEQVVFTSDYRKGDHLLLQELKNFITDFNPHLTVLHVSEKDTPVSQEVHSSFCHLTEEFLNYDQQIEFKRVVNKEEAYSIDKFMHDTNADILAMCLEEHGFLYRILHKSLIKKITSFNDYPVLIFHK